MRSTVSRRRPAGRPLRHHRLALASALAALPWLPLPAGAVQVVASWVGPASGAYGTASNWDTGKVPLNGSDTYVAYVAPGKAIGYAVSGARTLDSLLLDAGASFGLSSPSLILPNSLTVLGRALFGGQVSADVGSLTALGAGTDFIGNGNTASATGGAVLRIAATHFDSAGLGNRNILNAAGAGSWLGLSTLATLNAGFGGGNEQTVTASNHGTIDLSGLTAVIAPLGSNQSLSFSATGGSSLLLSSLQKVSGTTLNTGNTNFSVDASNVVLGPLQQANRLFVGLNNGATMSMGGYAGTAEISNSTFAAAAGSVLDASALQGVYATSLGNTTVMSASGSGSKLLFSALRSIDTGAAGGNVITVSASNGGVVDLSGVTKTVAPAGSNQSLVFNASGGGLIRLSSLQTAAGATLDTGNTTFNVDAASVVLGPLQQANRLFVGLNNGATMSMGGYAGMANITNSTFAAAAGSVLDASALQGVYATSLGNTTVMSASGSGSKLLFSALRSIDTRAAGGNVITVSATNGGVVDLSGVTKTVAPAGSNQSLVFDASGGGLIRLSSLQSAAGATLDTGNTTFNVDAASVVLGPLQQANRLFVGLNNGATMTMGGYAGMASITNSTFAVGAGSVLDARALLGDYAAAFGNTTVMSASGTGARLLLSGLRSLDHSAAGGNTTTVSATTSGLIDLSGVTRLVTPAGTNQALVFSASGHGLIRLGALQAPVTAHRGQLYFDTSLGGEIALGGFTADSGVHFKLTDAGSAIAVTSGKLALLEGSSLAAAQATRLSFVGGFSFAQSVASQVSTDLALLEFTGGALQTLEVGGKQLGALADGRVLAGNFSVGELTVGRSGGGASTLELVDALNNGNRIGNLAGTEALYLNGIGGVGNGNGLHLLAGSTLVLGGIDLYTTEGGRWLHVNDLFSGGVTRVAYDQGYIALNLAAAVPEPDTYLLMAGGLAALALLAWRRGGAAQRRGR